MNADAIGRAVVDAGEDGQLALLFGEGGSGIRAPQLIGHFREDAALVRIAGAHVRLSVREQQLVFGIVVGPVVFAIAASLLQA